MDRYYEVPFGKKGQDFFELSPFYFCTFVAGGKKWRTLVHYWCASFFKDMDMRELIRNLGTPEKAMLLARRHGMTDFDKCDPKEIIFAIQERVNQCEGVRRALLASGESTLRYTGEGYLANNNRYGRLIMRVRDIYESK